MSYKGYFKPKNVNKYRGDPTNIIYRSRWELKFLAYLDANPEIVQYASEEFFIPYFSPIDQKYHRYFPDFWFKKSNGENVVVEIKPLRQTQPPDKGNKKEKTYLTEVTQYIINKSKWEAAEKYCNNKNPPWKFILITEKELDIKF